MAVDVTNGIAHLNHPEDLVISNGVGGINTALNIISRFVDKVEDQTEESNSVIVSEKTDGSMSLYFGRDDQGKFFVSTKSILSKEQKLGYTLADIQRLWQTGVEESLMCAWKSLKPAFRENGVVLQCDLLFCSKTQKRIVDHEGQKYLTFQPNTILYAIPVDNQSDLYKQVKQAQLGVVVHGIYKAASGEDGRVVMDRLPENNIREIAKELNNNRNIFVIDPFVDQIEPFDGIEDIVTEIRDLIDASESLIGDIDSSFDEEWSSNSHTMIKEAKRLLPMFVNQQVRVAGDAESILTAKNEDAFLRTFKRKLKEFLNARSDLEQSKLKSSKGQERKAQHFKELQKWFDDLDSTFEPMLRSFFRILSIKGLIFKLFTNMENKLGKTFMVDKQNDFQLIATKPEGYVLLHGPNMIKIVDRVEFSRNNMLNSPFQEETNLQMTRGTTGDPESIGDKKPLKIKKSLTDEILEDVLDALEGTKELSGFNEVDAVDMASRTKEYNALWVGKMQPPTQAHFNVLEQLSKTFHKVLLLITDTGKYLDPELSVDLIQSAVERKGMRNVEVKLGREEGGIRPHNSVFGLSSKKPEIAKQSVNDIIKFFDLGDEDKERVFVLAQGDEKAGNEGEEDRFKKIKNTNTLFIVNDGEEPSEEKPFGLYAIPILRGDKGVKIGARQVREMINNEEFEEAKLKMAPGADDIKDQIIDSVIAKSKVEEEYFDIEGFNVDKEIINELAEDRCMDQTEATELLLEILQGE